MECPLFPRFGNLWSWNSSVKPISVVMSAFHASGTVGLAIRSTLLSMKSVDELIVVVGEADTETLDAVGQIKDSRIQLVIASDEASFPAKLNLGVMNSKNDLIARMDADDLTLPWRFWLQRKAMASGTVAIYCSTMVIFGTELRPLPVMAQLPIRLNSPEINEQLCFANPIPHPTVIMRKEVLGFLGGYVEKPGEDIDLWLRAAISGFKIRRMAIPTVLYRFSKTSLSRQADVKRGINEDSTFQKNRIELALKLGLIQKPPSHLGDYNKPDEIDLARKRKLNWKTRLAMLSLGLNS